MLIHIDLDVLCVILGKQFLFFPNILSVVLPPLSFFNDLPLHSAIKDHIFPFLSFVYCCSLVLPPPWSLFALLVPVVTPGYVLPSEDLELGASHEGDHALFVFLGLAYLAQYNIPSFIHCRFNTFIFFTDKYCDIVCLYYIFTIHSSLEGHLGCSHFPTIMNRATENMPELVSVE